MLLKNTRSLPSPFTALLRSPFSLRVRYAPSPTGQMHIGGLRTAWFNYLLARKHSGSFVLRIEDTDINRQVEGSTHSIFRSLQWLGITADESPLQQGNYGPYRQSQRMDLYKQIEKQLLREGKAYPCFCCQKEKDEEGHSKAYSGKCRNLSLEQIREHINVGRSYAVRIKGDLLPMPSHFHDQVFGQLALKPVDDFIIVRSNGWPTFHLANVVDDWKMKITHVIRGQEWLTNTNKHIYLYHVLKAKIPQFVHLPLIKSMNGKKLAKRNPESSVEPLINGHYEIQAVQSFLFGLGLSQSQGEERSGDKKTGKEKEVKAYSWQSMLQKFSLGSISRSPVKFDKKQLDHLNRLSIRQQWKEAESDRNKMEQFLKKLHHFVPQSRTFPPSYCARMLNTVIERVNFISDLSHFTYYFLPPNYQLAPSQKEFQQIFGPQAKLIPPHAHTSCTLTAVRCDEHSLTTARKIIHNLRMILEHIIPPEQYNQASLAKHISQFLFQSPELKNEEVYHLLRYMVSGRKSGVNITRACSVIGQQEVLSRISLFSSL